MNTGKNNVKNSKKHGNSVVFVPKDKDNNKKIKLDAKKRPFLFKMLILLCFSIFSYGCCSNMSGRETNSGILFSNIEHARKSTVAFMIENPRVRNTPYCTGFFVRDNRIASAAHCFIETFPIRNTDGREIELPVPGQVLIGKKVNFIRSDEYNLRSRRSIPTVFRQAEIMFADVANDVVILKTLSENDTSQHILTLATIQNNEHVGTRVFTIGHPANLPFTYLDGSISNLINDHDGTPFIIQATVPVSEGCSGGALINSQTGEVIGMSDAYVGRMHHLAIFISAHLINKLLEHEETRTNITSPPGRH